MDKPTNVVLKFDKATEGHWSTLVEAIDNSTLYDSPGTVIAQIPVKGYSLVGHQFVQLKLKLKNTKERIVLIPRHVVVMIAEGPGEYASYFAAGYRDAGARKTSLHFPSGRRTGRS